jgi:hypothetical protein
MTPQKLLESIDQCTKMLGKEKARVIQEAIDFSDVYLKHRWVSETSFLFPLHHYFKLPFVDGVKYQTGGIKPTREQVLGHLGWMLSEVMNFDKLFKRCRWFGFIAGAASCIDAAHYHCDQVGKASLHMMRRFALEPDSISHYSAHLLVGFFQGWLWAAGKGSIDDFRRMNMPEDKAFKVEA